MKVVERHREASGDGFQIVGFRYALPNLKHFEQSVVDIQYRTCIWDVHPEDVYWTRYLNRF
jgi:hypothetical protein